MIINPYSFAALAPSGAAGILAACGFTVSGGVVTVEGQKNVASVSRVSIGIYRVTFNSTLPTANYGFLGSARLTDRSIDGSIFAVPCNDVGASNYSTTIVDMLICDYTGARVDPQRAGLIIFDPQDVGSDYLAAAFVTVSGTTPTIQRHTNVSSVPRQGTVVYRPTFGSALPNSDYSVFGSSRTPTGDGYGPTFYGINRNTTGSINQQTTGLIDMTMGQSSRFGGPTAYTQMEPGRFSFLARNADVAPPGTLASARITVSGTTPTVVRQTNVSGVSRLATGVYRITFATALADTDYHVFCTGRWPNFTSNDCPLVSLNANNGSSRGSRSTTQIDVCCQNFGNGSTLEVYDPAVIDIWVVKPALM